MTPPPHRTSSSDSSTRPTYTHRLTQATAHPGPLRSPSHIPSHEPRVEDPRLLLAKVYLKHRAGGTGEHRLTTSMSAPSHDLAGGGAPQLRVNLRQPSDRRALASAFPPPLHPPLPARCVSCLDERPVVRARGGDEALTVKPRAELARHPALGPAEPRRRPADLSPCLAAWYMTTSQRLWSRSSTPRGSDVTEK